MHFSNGCFVNLSFTFIYLIITYCQAEKLQLGTDLPPVFILQAASCRKFIISLHNFINVPRIHFLGNSSQTLLLCSAFPLLPYTPFSYPIFSTSLKGLKSCRGPEGIFSAGCTPHRDHFADLSFCLCNWSGSFEKFTVAFSELAADQFLLLPPNPLICQWNCSISLWPLQVFILLWLQKWSSVSSAYFYENFLAQHTGDLWEQLLRENSGAISFKVTLLPREFEFQFLFPFRLSKSYPSFLC